MASKDKTESADDFTYAEGWRPEPGDIVDGTVIALDIGYSNFGEYPILTLETSDGNVAVHAFHHALRSRLEKIRPAIGDHLKIKYEGKKKNKAGTLEYHNYLARSNTAKQDNFWGPERTAPAMQADLPADASAFGGSDGSQDNQEDEIPF